MPPLGGSTSTTSPAPVHPGVNIGVSAAVGPTGPAQDVRVSSQPGGFTPSGSTLMSAESLNQGDDPLLNFAFPDVNLEEVGADLKKTVAGIVELDTPPPEMAPYDPDYDPDTDPQLLPVKAQLALGLPLESTADAVERLGKVKKLQQQLGGEPAATGSGGSIKTDLAAMEARLTQQLASDPGTERALMQRQALSAQAGRQLLAQYSEPLHRMGSLQGGYKLDKTTRLLDTIVAQQAEGELKPVLSATDGNKKQVSAQYQQAMGQYLGNKEVSKHDKAAATRHFLATVDRYLDGVDGDPSSPPPPLVGADESASGVLRPDEKVALLIARTVQKSTDTEGLTRPDDASLFVRLSDANDTEELTRPDDASLFERLSDAKQVGKEVTENVKQVLRGQFEPINKSITVAAAGADGGLSTQTYRSDLTPAQTVNKDFGTQGVLCSETHSTEHVPNLWSSRYRGPDGKTLFNGIRSGTLSAYGITAKQLKQLPKDELQALIKNTLPEEKWQGRLDHVAKKLTSRFSPEGVRLRTQLRQAANRQRALELVKFNLLNNEAAMEMISGQNAQSVELEIPSIMLITPDKGRRLLGVLGLKHRYDELRMTREQDRVLKELAQQPVPVTINTNQGAKTVQVQVTPMNFSFGVNKLAMGKVPDPSWSSADAINRGSIERLIGTKTDENGIPTTGLVRGYLSGLDPTITPQDKETVIQLTDQIRQLWEAKAHHKENNDPYALPARLALLTSKLGLTPAYNCKSGKDRTGQLDAEIKYLATRIERDGQVPAPGAELDMHERDLYRNIVMNSGNHDIQRLNTGHAGYKVKLDAITRRLGGIIGQLQHMGQGKYVSA